MHKLLVICLIKLRPQLYFQFVCHTQQEVKNIFTRKLFENQVLKTEKKNQNIRLDLNRIICVIFTKTLGIFKYL